MLLSQPQETKNLMTNVKVKFELIDNSAAIRVNGVQVWASTTNKAQEVDISDKLGAGSNIVRVDGINHGPWTTPNPYRYTYQVLVDGAVVAAVMQQQHIHHTRPSNTTSYVAGASEVEIWI